MSHIHVGLIGGGPRTLVILNALHQAIAQDCELASGLKVTIVDPNPGGVGCHDPNQPDYLYTNTLASQVTAFYPLEGPETEPGWITGPSFSQWAAQTGTRNCDGYFRHAAKGSLVNELDYLPRSLLGQYLAWAFQTIIARFPRGVVIRHRHTVAQSVKSRTGGYSVRLGDGTDLNVDYLFVSTGHSTNHLSPEEERLRDFSVSARSINRHAAYVTNCYPVKTLERISREATVAIQGLGLTAWDAIAQLTEGRGGRYDTIGTRAVYRVSGEEPKILIYSRNCLPFAARGFNQKGLTGRHAAQFFTPTAVHDLRARKLRDTGSTQLDFRSELLPLLRKEMALAYRLARLKAPVDPTSFEPSAEEQSEIDRLFDPFANRRFRDLEEYRDAFLEHVRDDLAEADLGNLSAPTKAATDVIRDCRAAICAGVEFRGLTPASEIWFRRVFAPLMNRISFGPPKFRNHQFMALFDAGVIDIAAGPQNTLETDPSAGRLCLKTKFEDGTAETPFDVLISARLDPFLPDRDTDALTSSLLSEGLLRPYRNGASEPGGFDITADHIPIGKHGQPTQRLWVTGIVTEGPVFYTHALPRAGMPSGQHKIARTCVSHMVQELRERTTRLSATAAE